MKIVKISALVLSVITASSCKETNNETLTENDSEVLTELNKKNNEYIIRINISR